MVMYRAPLNAQQAALRVLVLIGEPVAKDTSRHLAEIIEPMLEGLDYFQVFQLCEHLAFPDQYPLLFDLDVSRAEALIDAALL